MLHRLFTATSVLSLVLCIATLAMWTRQRWTRSVFGSVVLANHKFAVGCEQGRVRLFDWDHHVYGSWTHSVPNRRWDRQALGADGYIDGEQSSFGTRSTCLQTGSGPNDVTIDSGTEYWAPAPLVAGAFAFLPASWAIDRRRRSSRRLRNRLERRCVECGYDLRASSGRCPECGTPVPEGTT